MARPRIRILLIAPSRRQTGGQAVQASRLLSRLVAEPEIAVSFLPIDGAWKSRLARAPYIRTALSVARYLALLFRHVPRCDVVHVFSAGLWSFILWTMPAVLIGKALNRGVVINYRDGRAAEHVTGWRTARPILRLADEVITPSEFLVDVFRRYGIEARAIFNIMDLARFRFRERAPLRPAFMTNRMLEPLYNVGCVIRAFALIQAQVPEATLTIAHDGPCRAELEDLVRTLELRHVRFIGTVTNDEMARVYDEADVYLMSPNVDNMPGSLLECFASGVPLISTRAGGIPYIVDDGRTGLLVDIDDHRGMAEAAIRLLRQPAFAVDLTRHAYSEAMKYTWEGTVRAGWLEAYRRLAGRSSMTARTQTGAR